MPNHRCYYFTDTSYTAVSLASQKIGSGRTDRTHAQVRIGVANIFGGCVAALALIDNGRTASLSCFVLVYKIIWRIHTYRDYTIMAVRNDSTPAA